MPQKLKNAFQPAHQLLEKAIIVDMNLMHKLIEILLMPRTEVDKRLYGLIGVGRYILALSSLHNRKHIIGENGKIGNTTVDIGRFVYSDQWFVEDGEKVSEKLQSYGLCRSSISVGK